MYVSSLMPPLTKKEPTLEHKAKPLSGDSTLLTHHAPEESSDLSAPLLSLKQAFAKYPHSVERIEKEERALFFKQWIKNPKRLGTLAPISNKLANLAASCVKNPETTRLVEIGAGPGRLTRALLAHGVKPENMKAIELDPNLCAFAQKTLPHIDIIQGDAQYLPHLLPKDWFKEVDIVFSTIPLMCLPPEMRKNIMEASFNVLRKEGHILHLTYNYWSPLKDMHYTQEKAASTWLNLPPAFIWRYEKV